MPIRLPIWIRQGGDKKLTCQSIFKKFLAHIKQKTEKQSEFLDELQQLKFMKKNLSILQP